MSRSLSSNLMAAMTAEHSGEVALWCCVLEHDDLPSPLRVVNNIEDITVNGNTYTAVGFDLRLPEDKEGGKLRADITFNNTDQWLTPTVRQLNGDFTATFMLVVATNEAALEFSTVEVQLEPMRLESIQYDDLVVRGSLSYDNLANQQWPAHDINPWDFPGAF